MKRKVVLGWLVAMLIAVVVALWPAESRCSTDPMRPGVVVDGGIEEHAPRLATIETLRRGALIQIDVQQVEPTHRPRVRAVRRTARGPPG